MRAPGDSARNCAEEVWYRRHFVRLISPQQRDVVLLEISGDKKEDDGEAEGPAEELDRQGAEQRGQDRGSVVDEGDKQAGGQAGRGGERGGFERAREALLPGGSRMEKKGAAEQGEERHHAEEVGGAFGEFAEQGGHAVTGPTLSGWNRRGWLSTAEAVERGAS